MKKICMVCLGNICRSPMAEFVMKELASERTDLLIESRATSDWEDGNPIHQGTQGIFRKYGIPFDDKKRSKRISRKDLETFDMIFAMDENNLKDLLALSAGEYDNNIHLFDTKGIPDPWYTGDFEETYALVTRASKKWLKDL